jgi:hypothetical protein
MVTPRYGQCIPEGLSREEYSRLLLLRRDNLDMATAEIMGGQPMPVQWRRGWRAWWVRCGRDRDGSLLAEINVSGPKPGMRWRQRVRLVRQRRLPVNLR